MGLSVADEQTARDFLPLGIGGTVTEKEPEWIRRAREQQAARALAAGGDVTGTNADFSSWVNGDRIRETHPGYDVKRDANGNPVLDANGAPVYTSMDTAGFERSGVANFASSLDAGKNIPANPYTDLASGAADKLGWRAFSNGLGVTDALGSAAGVSFVADPQLAAGSSGLDADIGALRMTAEGRNSPVTDAARAQQSMDLTASGAAARGVRGSDLGASRRYAAQAGEQARLTGQAGLAATAADERAQAQRQLTQGLATKANYTADRAGLESSRKQAEIDRAAGVADTAVGNAAEIGKGAVARADALSKFAGVEGADRAARAELDAESRRRYLDALAQIAAGANRTAAGTADIASGIVTDNNARAVNKNAASSASQTGLISMLVGL